MRVGAPHLEKAVEDDAHAVVEQKEVLCLQEAHALLCCEAPGTNLRRDRQGKEAGGRSQGRGSFHLMLRRKQGVRF